MDRLASRLARAEADLKSAVRKAESAESARVTAESAAEGQRKAVADLRREVERLNESRANAEKAASYFEQRCSSAAAEVDAAKRELDSARLLESSARAIEVHVKGENARLKAEIESLSARLDKARQAPAEAVPAVVTGDVAGDEVRLLRSDVEQLRRKLAESDEMRRVAVRKAEHNRRAWLITQMQLDLAEDRLCLITTGKPRPVMDEECSGIYPDGEMVEAEEVEGGDEVGAATLSSDPE